MLTRTAPVRPWAGPGSGPPGPALGPALGPARPWAWRGPALGPARRPGPGSGPPGPRVRARPWGRPGPGFAPAQLLGKLEHTWAKPRYGRKSVRFRSPDLPPGRIFMKRTRGIRCLGSRGRWEPNLGILSWGGGGPMYAIVYPAWARAPGPGPRAWPRPWHRRRHDVAAPSS